MSKEQMLEYLQKQWDKQIYGGEAYLETALYFIETYTDKVETQENDEEINVQDWILERLNLWGNIPSKR